MLFGTGVMNLYQKLRCQRVDQMTFPLIFD